MNSILIYNFIDISVFFECILGVDICHVKEPLGHSNIALT